MDVVVLSGKGGTGKTTVSVNLSSVAGENITLLDCDVEEPNSHIFMINKLKNKADVLTSYPIINEEVCIHCGKCGDFCSFNAILNTKKQNIIMKELCHSCGGCKIVCPVGAIELKNREIGKIREGRTNNNQPFFDGILNTGEFSTTNIIHNVLNEGKKSKNRIIDAPPGTACAAVETVEGADFALIVTEPTPFALSDMKMVVEMLEKMKIPFGIFINKSGGDDLPLRTYCKNKGLTILGILPFKKRYGKAYAEGTVLSSKFPEVKNIFDKLWKDIINES